MTAVSLYRSASISLAMNQMSQHREKPLGNHIASRAIGVDTRERAYAYGNIKGLCVIVIWLCLTHSDWGEFGKLNKAEKRGKAFF